MDKQLPLDFATRLDRAIRLAAGDLGKEDSEWAELLTPDRAWSFALILAFWYVVYKGTSVSPEEREFQRAIFKLADDQLASSPKVDFYAAWETLKRYDKVLRRPAELAYQAADPLDIDRAAGAFKFAVSKIGLFFLKVGLNSKVFAALSQFLTHTFPRPEPSAQTASAEEGKGSRTVPARVVNSALSDRDRTMALLMSRGHSAKDAAKICDEGPQRLAKRVQPQRVQKA